MHQAQYENPSKDGHFHADEATIQAGHAQDKGYIHLYAGDGKGKTTAAVGLAIRAAARGWKVLFAQFLKSGNSAELKILDQQAEVKILSGQQIKKFTFAMTPEELAIATAETTGRLEDIVSRADAFDLVVLDEALGAVGAGLLPADLLTDFMSQKPAHLELVVTGRDPSPRMIELSDYYSEVCMRKHPYETEGLNARPGVEY
ncbi:MAG: cob(I)yrinic acid a,c-diamide adenosyltransferase [Eubacteriales bacterium]|nr:cob(I)yrinic acid a,c-diamide adenosyltransferase [Eubacteriales bacterium]